MRTVLPADSATLCLLTIKPHTGPVRLASAGQPPPLPQVDGAVTVLTPSGPLLGINAPGPDARGGRRPGGRHRRAGDPEGLTSAIRSVNSERNVHAVRSARAARRRSAARL